MLPVEESCKNMEKKLAVLFSGSVAVMPGSVKQVESLDFDLVALLVENFQLLLSFGVCNLCSLWNIEKLVFSAIFFYQYSKFIRLFVRLELA